MEKKAVPQHRSPGRFAMDVAFPIRIVPPRLAWLALDWSLGLLGVERWIFGIGLGTG
jgi:hypothetical protein